jgi:negative regulator of sigma E activity
MTGNQPSARQAPDDERQKNVQRAKELLNDYHDRELSDEERSFVEDALAKYPELAKESSMIVGIKNVLARYEGEDVKVDFSDKLMAKLNDEKKKKSSGYWKILIPVVVILLAISVLLLYYFP